MSNASDSTRNQSYEDRLIASITLLSTSVAAILLNLFVIFSLMRTKNFIWSQGIPYYGMLVSRCTSDLLVLLTYSGYCVPSILLEKNICEEVGERVVGSLRQLGYFTGLSFVVLVAVNRYVGVCHINLYKSLFSQRNTRIFIGTCWIVGGALSTPNLFPQFLFHFFWQLNTWGYPLKYKSNFGLVFADVVTHVVALSAIVVMYIKVFWRLKVLSKKFSNKAKTSYRRRVIGESQLTIEAITITTGVLIVSTAFYTIPMITLNPWFLLVNSCLSVVNCSLTAGLSFFHWHKLRSCSMQHRRELHNENFHLNDDAH